MPDHDNLLGETPETWQGNDERRGAPVLDMNDLEGLLGDTPQTWGGNDQKLGAPELEEQVVLDDPGQTWNDQKLGAPALDEQVQLEAPSSYTPEQKLGDVQLEGNMDDILGGGDPASYDPVAEFVQRLQFDDALLEKFRTLDAEQQQQVTAMRAQQLGIPAPMIPNELRPKIEEAIPEAAEVELEEAPQTEEYKPSFEDEDLKRIKEESKKPQKYTPPPMELTEEKKKENVRIMNELREEREREAAHKGFIQLIILTIVGIVGAVAFTIYFSCAFGLNVTEEAQNNGFLALVLKYAPIYGVIMGISALPLLAPIPQIQGITRFFHVVGFLIALIGGIMVLIQKDGHMPVNALLLVLAVGCTGALVFILTTSEAVSMYYKHGNS
ncbi:MAG: hypothetical protein K5695_04240 [Oscillospiraceae bacterium]|nr:hypothetical protein [Oscillospiraceae bacterium]